MFRVHRGWIDDSRQGTINNAEDGFLSWLVFLVVTASSFCLLGTRFETSTFFFFDNQL